jgi:hypothetical protein
MYNRFESNVVFCVDSKQEYLKLLRNGQTLLFLIHRGTMYIGLLDDKKKEDVAKDDDNDDNDNNNNNNNSNSNERIQWSISCQLLNTHSEPQRRVAMSCCCRSDRARLRGVPVARAKRLLAPRFDQRYYAEIIA